MTTFSYLLPKEMSDKFSGFGCSACGKDITEGVLGPILPSGLPLLCDDCANTYFNAGEEEQRQIREKWQARLDAKNDDPGTIRAQVPLETED